MRIINNISSLELAEEVNTPEHSFQAFLYKVYLVLFLACASMGNRRYVCLSGLYSTELRYGDFSRLTLLYSPQCSIQGEDLVDTTNCCSPMTIIPSYVNKSENNSDFNYMYSSSFYDLVFRSLIKPISIPFNKYPIYPPYDGVTDLRLEEELEVVEEVDVEVDNLFLFA